MPVIGGRLFNSPQQIPRQRTAASIILIPLFPALNARVRDGCMCRDVRKAGSKS
jgi:hypothetical protein